MRFSIRVILCSLLTCALVWAQATVTSNITGTVTDASGLAVPGAEVQVTQTETGLVRTVASGADGGYLVTNLPVGPYRLQVTKQGFSTYAQSGIVLQVNSNPTINVALKVGAVTEQIQVEASAAIVETQNTAVGQVVDTQRVLDLPLNGRNTQELILNSGPAVNMGNLTTVSGAKRVYPGLQISIAGGSLLGTLYVLDGADHNNVENNSPLPIPFPDALQEFKVETSSMPARYGHHAAAAINMITKSGTNDMHGDLFEFIRNGDVNARNTFAAARDTLKRNQFGGVIGGAIIKNKLFYFGGYQGTILRTDPGTSVTVVPTKAMLAGDFTTFPAAGAAGCQAKPVTLGAPFVGNQLSPALISPITAKIAASFPTPADQKCGQVTYGFPQQSDEKMILTKVDYQKSDKHSLFARFFTGRYVLNLPVPDLTANLLGGQQTGQRSYADTGLIGDTYLISPTTINTFRLSMQYVPNNNTAPTYVYPKDLGINIPALSIYPFFGVNITGGFSFGNAGQTNLKEPESNFQLTNDIDMTRGNHQIAVGVNWAHIQYNYTSQRLDNGEFVFNATRTGLGYADFVAGLPNLLQQGYAALSYQRGNVIGLYGQDGWKVSRRLTVNLGVRWEPFLPAQSEAGHIFVEQFDMGRFLNNVKSTVFPNAPAGLYFKGDQGWTYGNAIANKNWKQFSPRIGIVFDPKGDGKQVVRAGYGIFYDVPTYSFQINSANNAPFGNAIQLQNPNLANPYANYPGGDPYLYTLGPQVVFPLGGYYNLFSQNLPTVNVQSWNLGYQRQFGANWAWTITYLGSKTTHQWLENEQNPAFYIPGASCVINGQTYTPCSSTGNTTQRRLLSLLNVSQGQYYDGQQTTLPVGNATYEGLTTNVNKRLSRNVSMQLNFTWSHCISVAEQGTINNHYDSQDPFNFNTSRGDCNQDVRRNFNSSFVFTSPKVGNSMMQKLTGNWLFSPIFRWTSGLPLTVLSGKDNALDGVVTNTGGGVVQRPNLVCDPGLSGSSSQSWAHWFNQSCYVANGPGQLGNSGRNSIRGPQAIYMNVALSRTFTIHEKQHIEVRAEAFNLPNFVNYLNNGINVTLTSSLFGKLTPADDPRILQFALKYVF